MALRNAFEAMATEGTLRRILAAVSFSRDSSDRMRVVVDNAPQAIVYVGNSSTSINAAGLQRTMFDASAIYMVDEREQQRVQSEQAFNQVRTQRWSFS